MKTKSIITGAFIGAIAATGAYAAGENIVTSKYYVDTEVATKQPKLLDNGSDVAVTYPAQLGGTPNQRTIGTSVTTGDNLVTTGGVNTALNAKQQKISGTQNTVVTYGATDGATGSKAVYNASGSYTSGALAEAGHVNTTVINGFNAHLTCADPVNGTSSNCNLWQINDLTGGTYVPHN